MNKIVRYSSRRINGRALGLCVALVSAPLSGANAVGNVNVVELFTSQGCYSCPAADKLLAKVAAKNESILNLEFHVDYWNQLQYGSAGSWQDPFSHAEFTKRQRLYHQRVLRGENGVYTPQAVVNGVYGLVGSNRRELKKSLTIDSPRPAPVSIVRTDDNTLTVNVNSGESLSADILLVSYLIKTSTEVKSGENHGKIMENHNVVVDMRVIGSLSGVGNEAIQVAYQAEDNKACAVLVQAERQGLILGAARCP